MRIAARWIGLGSLAAAAVAVVVMVVVISAPLWLERPPRVTHCGKDIADLIRTLRHACADRHDARACRTLDGASQRLPALLIKSTFH